MYQQLTLDQAFSSVTKTMSNPPSNPPDPKKNTTKKINKCFINKYIGCFNLLLNP